jgi:hypothetical protein
LSTATQKTGSNPTCSDEQNALVDAVVVGAKLSGLICSRELRRQGLRVRLWEARERWGEGSTATRPDQGCGWISAASGQGLRRYPHPHEGDGRSHWNGKAHRARIEHDFPPSLLLFRSAELGLPAADLEQTLAVLQRFADLVARVPPQGPGGSSMRPCSDRLSIAGWLERQGAGELAGYPPG